MRVLLQAILALAAPLVTPLLAQHAPVGGWIEDYARLMQLTGQLPVTPVTVRPSVVVDLDALSADSRVHPWRAVIASRRVGAPPASDVSPRVSVLPVELRTFANTGRPWGWNDGAVWQGKGVTMAAQAGGTLHWGRFSLTLAPLATYSANAESDLSPLAVPPGLSPYAYPVISGGTMDAPQRFGDESFRRVDWGNSNVRVDVGPLALGLSHENLWWGPGVRNDVMFTNNAPGFWHAHLTLAKPVSVGLGTVTGRWIWGSLRESAFFDTVSSNDRRYMTGAAVSFVPRWGTGLELGAGRVFQRTWPASFGADDILTLVRPVFKNSQVTPGNPTGDDETDQMAAVWVRWALPSSGLELYGEWAKGDHSSDILDLLVEPEHASGYLMGLSKVLAHSSERTWRFASELTLLGAPRTTLVRSQGAGFFYVHGTVPQGHTHRGQVLGAGIGPGSSQLSISVDRFTPWGKLGASVFRTVYDNDRYYRRPDLGTDFKSHEVEPSVQGEAMWFRGPWDLEGAVTWSMLLNQGYVRYNDRPNLNARFTARYHPGSTR